MSNLFHRTVPILVAFLFCFSCSDADGANALTPVKRQQASFTGIPQPFTEAKMLFARLVDQKGKKTIHVGAYGNMSDEVRDCLNKAENGKYAVVVSGTLNEYSDKSRGMEETGLQCRPARNEDSSARVQPQSFFSDAAATRTLIDRTLELGEKEGIKGLNAFAANLYKEIPSVENANAAEVAAKVCWYSLVWAITLNHYSGDSSQQAQNLDVLKPNLEATGALFGWSKAEVKQMLTQTLEKFQARIKQKKK